MSVSSYVYEFNSCFYRFLHTHPSPSQVSLFLFAPRCFTASPMPPTCSAPGSCPPLPLSLLSFAPSVHPSSPLWAGGSGLSGITRERHSGALRPCGESVLIGTWGSTRLLPAEGTDESHGYVLSSGVSSALPAFGIIPRSGVFRISVVGLVDFQRC